MKSNSSFIVIIMVFFFVHITLLPCRWLKTKANLLTCSNYKIKSQKFTATCDGKNLEIPLINCIGNNNGELVKGKNFSDSCFCSKKLNGKRGTRLVCFCGDNSFPKKQIRTSINLVKVITIANGNLKCWKC